MLTLLHNPRCRKSREGLEILEGSGENFEVREYLKNPLNKEELENLQGKLWMKFLDFTRIKEKEFIEAGLTKNSSENEILETMVKFPKLMERPILISDSEAVVGRPPENFWKILAK